VETPVTTTSLLFAIAFLLRWSLFVFNIFSGSQRLD